MERLPPPAIQVMVYTCQHTEQHFQATQEGPSLLTHKFHPAPYNTHDCPRLHHLPSTPTKAILHLRQTIQPRDHDRRRDIQLAQFFCQRSNDIRERQALVRFQGVNELETGRDVARFQQSSGDRRDVSRVWRSDALVDGRLGDLVADYGAGVWNRGAFNMEGRACAQTCKLDSCLSVLWRMGEGGLTACVAGLEDVQGASHVAFAELYEGVGGGRGYVYVLLVDYFVDEHADIVFF